MCAPFCILNSKRQKIYFINQGYNTFVIKPKSNVHFSFLAFGDNNTKAFYCFGTTATQITQNCTVTYSQGVYEIKLSAYSGINVIAYGEYDYEYSTK